MKNTRQSMILELIRDHCIDKQETLQAMLAERGFSVTQATVSRDIRELHIIKSAGEDGIYRYRTNSFQRQEETSDTFTAILRQAARETVSANNLVVVKTYTGMGNAVGAAVDAMNLPDCVGTLAGDDTLLIIAKNTAAANEICGFLKRMLEKEPD